MSLLGYPKYRDSGVEWLGEVPEHWTIAPVKNLATIVNGLPFDSALFDPSEGTPLVRIRDLGKTATEACYKGDFVDGAAITSDDVLIGMDGDFNVGRWRGQGMALLNQRMCCVRGTTEFLTRLLEYSLPIPLRALNEITYATTVKHLSSGQVAKTFVAIPRGHTEQLRMLEFLDRETAKIDALTAEQQRLIKLLKEKRHAVISHAVTKGMNPGVPMKPSGVEWLGDVPSHWHAKRVRSLFRQEKRQGQVDKEVLSVFREYGVVPKRSRDDNYNKTPEDLSAYQLVNPGDLVVNKMKAWQGSLGISKYEGITSPDYIVFAPRRAESSAFLHLLLRSQKMVPVYRSISNGIRPQQWRLEPDQFLNLRIFLPAVPEQEEIASFVAKLASESDVLCADAERAITLLQERRTALISAAVTGKIDVRNHAAAGVA